MRNSTKCMLRAIKKKITNSLGSRLMGLAITEVGDTDH